MIGLILGASNFSTLPLRSRSVVSPEILQRFLDTFLYREQAVLVDEIAELDVEAKRIVIRFEFRFKQGDYLVYQGDQSAMFVKGKALA